MNKTTVTTLKNLSHLWYKQVKRYTCDVIIQNWPFVPNENTLFNLENIGVTVPSDYEKK